MKKGHVYAVFTLCLLGLWAGGASAQENVSAVENEDMQELENSW